MDTMDIAALYQQRIRLTQDFLSRLQQARVIRADINPATAAYVTNCLQFGFLQMQNTIQADGQPALEHTISMIVNMLDSYLTPQQGGDSEAGKVVVREMAAQFYTLLEQAENLST